MFDFFSLGDILARLVVLGVALPVHEAAHAWVAHILGDDTAKRQGRLTLNPLAHLDPIGALMIFFAFFGWAKPVPVNPWRLRHGPRVGMALVAAAGPLSNLALATLMAIPWRAGVFYGASMQVIEFALTFVAINVGLFLFNLLPIAPLDGLSVLSGVVGQRAAAALQPLQTYGPFIFMGLILLSYISPRLNVIGQLLNPAVLAVARLLLGA